MSRTILIVAVLTGLGGFALGWLAFDSRTAPAPVLEPSTTPPATTVAPTATGPVQAKHEFSLLPADVLADRETPAVAADDQGHVILAWASQTGENERTLHLARSQDGGTTFEKPVAWRKVPIYRYASKSKTKGKGKGKELTFSTHVLPRLAWGRDALYLGWVEAVDGGPKVIDYVARSTDGGRTFAEPVPAHGGDAAKPGFTALAVGPDGAVDCAWLDGRNKAPQPFASAWPADSAGFGPEQLVYPGPEGQGICPCCDLAVTRAPGGARFVAFRNSAEGNRDIWLARSASDTAPFESPMPVTSDGWKFEGCPHDAPALAVAGDRLQALWMDGHSGKNRVYFASSPLPDLRFRPREVSPGTPGAQGHPKLAPAGGDDVHAVWDEALDDAPAPARTEASGHGHGHGPALTGSGRAIMHAHARNDGLGPARAVAPRPGAFQLQPAVAAGADGAAYVAWNELDETGKRIVFVRLAPSGERP